MESDKKFAVDAMLGKLARWLRILGYDTTYRQEIADDELVRNALDEGRIILTRDTLLVKRLPPGSFLFIVDDVPADQLRQAVHELGLAVEEARLLS
ncbi:MAG TPA: Mut7-C RNAse domain-containing protein, partial [Nitrospirota bacterium]